MAVPFGERFDSGLNDSTPSDSIRWNVNAPWPANPLTAPGVPSVGSAHPRIPGLYLDFLRVAEYLNARVIGDCIVEGVYSADGRHRPQPRRDDNSTTISWWSIVPQRTEKVVPVFMATPRYAAAIGINTAGEQVYTGVTTSYEWVKVDRKIPIWREVYSRKVTIANVMDFAPIRDTITAQYDQMHKLPDGNSYLFIPPLIEQKDQTTFEIQYQWMFEFPVPLITVPNAPTAAPADIAPYYFIKPPPFPGDTSFPAANSAITCPGFYDFQVIPGALEFSLLGPGGDPDTATFISIPSVVAVDTFKGNRDSPANPNGLGWQSLPGNPIT